MAVKSSIAVVSLFPDSYLFQPYTLLNGKFGKLSYLLSLVFWKALLVLSFQELFNNVNQTNHILDGAPFFDEYISSSVLVWVWKGLLFF